MKAPVFACSLWIAATTIATAHAATSGNLNFSGEIQGGTCNLASGDTNRTIILPPVKVSDFDSSTWAGLHTFDLTANCDPDIRNVTFTFSGTQSPWSPTHFHNTGNSRGIVTVIQSRIGGVAYNFPANGTATARSRTIATTAGRAVIPMGAHYMKIPISTVTKGTLVTAAFVTISYN